MASPARVPRIVWVLGGVSFLTDCSSEMIYPLLPLFLSQTLGTGPAILGLVEGAAESLAALLKVVSGIWSDRVHRRKPLVVAGYALSSLARPLISLVTGWTGLLALRLADRFGKGVRSSPRDALIADQTPLALRGRAYGLHRAMDHAGAVVGPLLAWLLLSAAELPLRQIFALAAIPAALTLALLIFGVREEKRAAPGLNAKHSPVNWAAIWRVGGTPYRRFLLALFIFTLGNSTDAFLLSRLSEAGLSLSSISLLWGAHHVVKMVSSIYGGRLSDFISRKKLILAGWAWYSCVYLVFATGHRNSMTLIATFLAYGLYYGLTEPAEKALISELAPEELRGSAFGLYHLVVGLGALPASFLFGAIWQNFGAGAAFMLGAALAAAACALLSLVPTAKGH